MTRDITKVPIHLGVGGTASPVDNFDWTDERLAAYDRATRTDGADGRMVMMFHMAGAWTTWERHPLGAEVLIACTGTHRFVQEFDDGNRVVEITAGQALINPPGVWHTADTGKVAGSWQSHPAWTPNIARGEGEDPRRAPRPLTTPSVAAPESLQR